MRVVESFDEMRGLAGQEIGVSDWIEVDQERINTFAEATGDFQWIHVDTERAKNELPDGKCIAAGSKNVLKVWRVGNLNSRLNRP